MLWNAIKEPYCAISAGEFLNRAWHNDASLLSDERIEKKREDFLLQKRVLIKKNHFDSAPIASFIYCIFYYGSSSLRLFYANVTKPSHNSEASIKSEKHVVYSVGRGKLVKSRKGIDNVLFKQGTIVS